MKPTTTPNEKPKPITNTVKTKPEVKNFARPETEPEIETVHNQRRRVKAIVVEPS